MKKTLLDDIEPVIASGNCVGCGACAAVADGSITMVRTVYGACVAEVRDREKVRALPGGICPFSDSASNEDEHGSHLFGENLTRHEALGYVRSTWAGHSANNGFRDGGSSGGITSWVVVEALRQGAVDVVVHVHPGHGGDLFAYCVSRSVDEVRAGAKTRYYSVNFAEALRDVRASGERFALVGVPCFIKAARNLAQQDTRLQEQLVLTVALVCGHMKSAGFAESLAWQVGVAPEHIGSVDFRVKLRGVSADQYAFCATDKSTKTPASAPMAKLAGRGWDGGYHRLQACDYCDDVFGETADVTCGDAWLPEFAMDPRGTNIVVSRSALAERLLQYGLESGALELKPLAASRTVASQTGGLRDRREGLAYRLLLDDRADKWRPRKRIEPSSEGLSILRKLNYRLRRIVRKRSATSLVFCKRLGSIKPYQIEMTFWAAFLRLLRIAEIRVSRK